MAQETNAIIAVKPFFKGDCAVEFSQVSGSLRNLPSALLLCLTSESVVIIYHYGLEWLKRQAESMVTAGHFTPLRILLIAGCQKSCAHKWRGYVLQPSTAGNSLISGEPAHDQPPECRALF